MTALSSPNRLTEHSDPGVLRAYYELQGEEAACSGQGIRCSEETITRAVIELLRPELNSFESLLDVGCGANLAYDLFLAEQGKNVLGLEYSVSFLKLAPRHPRIQLIQGTASALPFGDGTFSAVVCSETLEHLKSDATAVAEIARVLRPGGIAVITVPNLWNLARLIDMVKRRSLAITMMEGHLREYTRSRLHKLLAPNFRVERRAPVPFGWSGQRGSKLDTLVRSGVLARVSKSIAVLARRR